MSRKTVISIGHGSNAKGTYDSGAVSRDGKYHEHKIAREIGKYAAEYLGCDLINYDGSRCLEERIADVNAGSWKLAAEIHLNAGGGTGTETFYYHNSPTGKKAAQAVSKAISDAFGVRNRGAKVKLNAKGTDYFGFIRQTEPCALLIETLFIDCDSDLEKVKTEEGMKKCGYAVGRALEGILADNDTYRAADNLIIYEGPGTKYENTGVMPKGRRFTVTVTSSDGKWARLKEGGWVRRGKGKGEKV